MCNRLCDNTKCFNPEHLFIGTANDNMQDTKKGVAQTESGQLTSCTTTEENNNG
jgi:hypothetical protein